MIDKIGRYKLGEKLDLPGLGGFWRGEDLLTGQAVLVQSIPFTALCALDDRSALFRRLLARQRKAGELEHRAIRRVLGLSRTADLLFLFHDFRVGRSLSSVLTDSGERLAPTRTIACLKDIAAALEVLHQRGWSYGRLTPLGVWLDEEGAFLVDYDLEPLLLEAADQWRGELSHP